MSTDPTEVLRAANRTLELNLDSLNTLADAVEAITELLPIIEHQIEVTEATIAVVDEALNPPVPVIPAPTGLVASTNLANRIEVSWDEALGADFYVLYVDGVAQDPTVGTDVNFGRMDYGQQVEFAVAAMVGNVVGQVSATVVGQAAARPVLPSNIGVGEVTADSVEITWDSIPPETPGVQIHRTENGGISWRSLTAGAIGTSFVDRAALAPGADYTYRVRGYSSYPVPKASPWSPEFSVRTLSENTPEPPAPEPSDFVALEQIGNSSEQNKDVRLPAVRATRTGRALIGTIGDVKRSDWNMGDGDLLKENLESVVPEGYAQWSSNLHKKLEVRPGDYTWKNIGVSPGEGASQLKWGTREFNAPFRQFLECDFTGIPREHGLYVSNNAGTEVRDCTFLLCGSQGVQFAHRPLPYQQYDGDNLPYAEPPLHIVENCHFVDNAYKGDRPSFNLTYFNPGTSENPGTIVVENSTFVCNWPEPKFYAGRELRSTGAMVVSNMQGNEPLVGNPMMDSITLRNCLFDYTKNDRAIISLRSVEELLIEDCVIIARDSGYPLVSMDKYIEDVPTKSKVITVRNTYAEGGTGLKIRKIDGSTATIDMNCVGEEIVIDAVEGVIVSRRTL